MSTQTLDLAIAGLKNAHADLVAKEEQRAAASKGKAKATQEDETRDAEYRQHLEEYNSALNELLQARQKQSQEAEAEASQTDFSEAPDHKFSDTKITTNSNQGTKDKSDKEPFLNPFTGSYIFPETGVISS